MFDKFVEECGESPNQSEIRLFNESILDKMNRSSTQFTKILTPFLSDKSDIIAETYTPPAPSTAGLDPEKQYAYAQFPRMNLEIIGPVRQAKILSQEKEVRRAVGEGSILSSIQSSATFKVKKIDVEITLFEAKNRFSSVENCISIIQAKWRMRPLRRKYRILRNGILKLQIIYRRIRREALWASGLYLRNSIKLQSIFRMWIARKMFLRAKKAFSRIQALCRRKKIRIWYLNERKRIIKIQTLFRKYIILKKQKIFIMKRLAEYRKQLCFLWDVLHTPLIYRSYFWLKYSTPSYFHLSLHELEIANLYKFIGYPNSGLMRRSFGHISQAFKGFSATANDINRKKLAETPLVIKKLEQENSERKNIYLKLKGQQNKSKLDVDSYFRHFNLHVVKRRKHTLSESLWKSVETSTASADILIGLMGGDVTFGESRADTVALERLSWALAEISRASLVALQQHRRIDKK